LFQFIRRLGAARVVGVLLGFEREHLEQLIIGRLNGNRDEPNHGQAEHASDRHGEITFLPLRWGGCSQDGSVRQRLP
jgi:hypothetical protein